MSARILIALLFVCGAPGAAFADTVSDAATRVQTTHAALESANTDFSAEVAAGRLSESEQGDYRRYLSSLTERLRDHCRDFQLAGGDPASLSGQCDISAPATPRAAAIEIESERTTGERIRDAEAELRAAMGDFDQALLREQERLRNKGASGGGGGGSGQQDGSSQGGRDGKGTQTADTRTQGSGTQGSGTQTDGEVTETVSGRPQSEGDSSAKSGEKGERQGQNRKDGTGKGQGQGRGKGTPDGAPPGTPGGDDDDVIARQLREAAENETDPELRAKLWDEYRRYKDEQD